MIGILPGLRCLHQTRGGSISPDRFADAVDPPYLHSDHGRFGHHDALNEALIIVSRSLTGQDHPGLRPSLSSFSRRRGPRRGGTCARRSPGFLPLNSIMYGKSEPDLGWLWSAASCHTATQTTTTAHRSALGVRSQSRTAIRSCGSRAAGGEHPHAKYQLASAPP